MRTLSFLFVLALAHSQSAPKAQLAILGEGGIEFKFPDQSGLQEIGVHYNINEPILGENGHNNYEITSKSGDGMWHHINNNIVVNKGDTVNYALYYKINGVGHIQEGLTWTAGGSASQGHNTNSSITPRPTAGTQTGNLKLIFEDDFSGRKLDLSKWKQEVSAFGGGNWEFQVYTPDPENTFIKNGVLHMKPTLTADKFGENFLYHGDLNVQQQWGVCTDSRWYGCERNSKDNLIPPILSSKIISKIEFKYGRVEVVAQLPLGDWIWPSIWLMPTDFHYGGWPMSGEIDIVEARCNRELGDIGIKRIMSTLHWGPKPEQDMWTKTTQGKTLSQGTWADDFHKYTLDWTADHITILVDDSPILNRSAPSGGFWSLGGFSGNNIWTQGEPMAPFDQKFHFQMNVAVGGTLGYFPDGISNDKPWCNTCPDAGQSNKKFWEGKSKWLPTWQGDKVAMKVKSVKIWSY